MSRILPRVKKRIGAGLIGSRRVRAAVLGVSLAIGLGFSSTSAVANLQATDQAATAARPDVLLLIPADPTSIDAKHAYHYSHRSHYSHYSHYSHRSHYSHYSSYY